MKNNNSNLRYIRQLKSVAENLNEQRLHSEIDELSEKITGEKFYLVMLGLFKRGKSSLINALLGDKIVPTGVIPLTAIITLIEFSSEKYAEIFFIDSESIKVGIDEVNRYVAEQENPKNIKKVKFVKIYHNSEILKSITIIDTPGVGSSLEHNTETTNEFIDKIDAALFVLSVDVPITKAEVEFLKKIKGRIPKVIFVMNKIDLFTKEQLADATDYNKGVLNEICDKQPLEFIEISSLNALKGFQQHNKELLEKSNFSSLLQRIKLLAESEKTDIMNLAVKHRLLILTNELISKVKFRIHSLKMPALDLEKKLKEFQSLISMMKNEKSDFDILMEGRAKQLQNYISEKVNEISVTLIENLEKDFNQNQSELLERMKREDLFQIQDEFINKLKKNFDELKSDLEKEVIEQFQNILIKYSSGSNEFMSKLLNSLGEMFDFDLSYISEKFDLNVYTSFYYNFESEPTVLGLNKGMIRNKMPKYVVKKLVYDKMLDSLIEKIHSNCGRIIYDITYKIQESFIKFKFDVSEKNDKMLNDLENILSNTLKQKQLTEDDIHDEIHLLTEKLEILEKIKNEIAVEQ